MNILCAIESLKEAKVKPATIVFRLHGILLRQELPQVVGVDVCVVICSQEPAKLSQTSSNRPSSSTPVEVLQIVLVDVQPRIPVNNQLSQGI